MDEDHLQAIRDRDQLARDGEPLYGLLPAERDVSALLSEIDRLRAVIDDLADNPDAPEIASLHASAHRLTERT